MCESRRASAVRLAVVGLALSTLSAACSAGADEQGSAGGGTPSGGASGGSNGGASNGGASAGGGATSAGSNAGGFAGTAGSGVSAAGGTGGAAGGTGGSSGSGGAATGGVAGGGAPDCVPNPAGSFMVNGDVVFDPKTCLTWMKTNTSGDPYAAAESYCAGLSLGGYDDWRLPTAGEVVSIFKCTNTYPPVFDVFTVMGDGIWTTTLSGTIAGDEPKVCGAGQASGQFYDFGKVGGQNTRCVRGAITRPDRADCKTNTMICSN